MGRIRHHLLQIEERQTWLVRNPYRETGFKLKPGETMHSPATVMVAGFHLHLLRNNVHLTYSLSLNKILG